MHGHPMPDPPEDVNLEDVLYNEVFFHVQGEIWKALRENHPWAGASDLAAFRDSLLRALLDFRDPPPAQVVEHGRPEHEIPESWEFAGYSVEGCAWEWARYARAEDGKPLPVAGEPFVNRSILGEMMRSIEPLRTLWNLGCYDLLRKAD